MPSLVQINHNLNIFKAQLSKPEMTEALSKRNSPRASDVRAIPQRVQSAKATIGGKSKSKNKKNPADPGVQTPNTPNIPNIDEAEEDEEGVKYYSFQKKMHLKFKQKRLQMMAEELQKKKEQELEAERLEKEKEQAQVMSSLAELDEEMMKQKNRYPKGDDSSVAQSVKAPFRNRARQYTLKKDMKSQGNIFERLTKDYLNQNKPEEEEEDPATKRIFLSNFAEQLYKEMQEYGDTESFKKVAQAKIINYKKDFKEKNAKIKGLQEGITFTKEKNKYLNQYVPDVSNEQKENAKRLADSIFVPVEVTGNKATDDNREENVILFKLSKMYLGNILEFWKDTKDSSQ